MQAACGHGGEAASRARKGLAFPIIKGRVKSFDSWYAKRIRLLRNAKAAGKPPIPITDIVALRVVCPFLGDLTTAESSICASFKVLEVERKGAERSFREFGYESIHLLIELPDDLERDARGLDSPVVEVQLRTIFRKPGPKWSTSSSTRPSSRPSTSP